MSCELHKYILAHFLSIHPKIWTEGSAHCESVIHCIVANLRFIRFNCTFLYFYLLVVNLLIVVSLMSWLCYVVWFALLSVYRFCCFTIEISSGFGCVPLVGLWILSKGRSLHFELFTMMCMFEIGVFNLVEWWKLILFLNLSWTCPCGKLLLSLNL
jgi:hypothetical protein